MAEAAQTVTREQLHELVWRTPMTRLAERFGLSDVGLRKVCRKLDVPTPPLGWWAKKSAGKAVRVAELPDWRPGIPRETTIAPTPAGEADLQQAVRTEAERAGEIAVPERLARPHPMIAGWIADHRQRRENAREHRQRWPGSQFTVPDFTAAERRRHRVLHALFAALGKKGATIAENDRRQLVATMEGEDIAFTCHEKSRQVRRPLTDDEKRWSSRTVRTELEPTGFLELQIHAWHDQPLRRTWRESEKRPLETMLAEIVATFVVLAPVLAERSRRREEQARVFAERQRQLELERERRQQDDNRWRRFLQIADGWKRAELAREFIARFSFLPPRESLLLKAGKFDRKNSRSPRAQLPAYSDGEVP